MVKYFMPVFLLISGIALLALSSNYLVEAAVTIAKKFKISSAVVGLTIVAAGTSLPELTTSLIAALNQNSDIALGNAVGSNLFNTFGILGLSGLITMNYINANSKKIEIPMMVFSYSLILVFSLNLSISKIEGLIAFIMLVVFMFYSVKNAKVSHEIIEPVKNQKIFISLIVLVVSLIGLMFGADLALKGGIEIGKMIGLSDRVIGLTIVAIGTSLPEIGATITAAIKGEKEMAVANVVGSNIFNSLGILGITSMIKPISVSSAMLGEDLAFMMISGLFLWVLAYVRPSFARKEGVLLSVIMILYIGYLIKGNI